MIYGVVKMEDRR